MTLGATCLLVNLLRLHLHPCHSIHNKHAAVKNAHAALDLSNVMHINNGTWRGMHLNGEVDVAGRVHQVDVMRLPLQATRDMRHVI